MVGKIINLPKPLTQNQKETLEAYEVKEKLTEKQKETLYRLRVKFLDSNQYKLSESNKKVLRELVYAETYKRRIELNAPQIAKGLTVEKDCRDLLTRLSGIYLTKCDERKENEWVSGQIDVEPNNCIIDIKSTWSWDSFSNILEEKPNEIYLRQLDSYMDLWSEKDSLLCHILVDTPYNLVEDQIRKFDYKNNILDFEGNVRDEYIGDVKRIVCNHIFTRKGIEEFCGQSMNIELDWFNDFIEIPDEKRLHMIPHEYSQERIEQRNKCIILAREYMNTVKPINNLNLNLI